MERGIHMAEKTEKKETLTTMLCDIFTGPLKNWVYLTMVFGLGFTVLFIYSLWQFWIAETVTTHLHWGLAVILSAMVIMLMKIWFWMLMMRNSIVRALGK